LPFVIDLHCHVLPGIDDGPETIEGSVALGRAAAAAGTRTIVATPHVNSRYPNTAAAIARLVEVVNERFAAEGLAVEVLAGAELAMMRVGEIPAHELPELELARSGWVLAEPPFSPVASGLEEIVRELQRRGHRVVLAHPERCAAFHRDPRLLTSLLRSGALSSVTAGSLVGGFGERVRRFALDLARQGMLHNVASDAHDHADRPPSIAREIEQAGLAPLADWLTQDVPMAILEGARTLPPRPHVKLAYTDAKHRTWWRRRG
jgi:protein-tyrosine phosphatase